MAIRWEHLTMGYSWNINETDDWTCGYGIRIGLILRSDFPSKPCLTTLFCNHPGDPPRGYDYHDDPPRGEQFLTSHGSSEWTHGVDIQTNSKGHTLWQTKCLRTGKSPFYWENPVFQRPCSIAMWNSQRVNLRTLGYHWVIIGVSQTKDGNKGFHPKIITHHPELEV